MWCLNHSLCWSHPLSSLYIPHLALHSVSFQISTVSLAARKTWSRTITITKKKKKARTYAFYPVFVANSFLLAHRKEISEFSVSLATPFKSARPEEGRKISYTLSDWCTNNLIFTGATHRPMSYSTKLQVKKCYTASFLRCQITKTTKEFQHLAKISWHVLERYQNYVKKILTDKYRIYFDKYFQTLITCAVKNVYFFSTWLYTVSLCLVILLPTTLQNIPLGDTLYIKLFRYSWYFKNKLTIFYHFWNKILKADLENRTWELLNISKK